MSSDAPAPDPAPLPATSTGWPPPPDGALHDLADTLPHAIAITDATGLVTWANHGFTRLTGFGAWDAAGRSFTGLVRLGGADVRAMMAVGDALAAGRPYATTISLYRKDGALCWADLDLRPVVDAAGTVVSTVAVLTDVTTREQATSRLAQAEPLAALGTLAAGVAHEIATPVQFVGDSLQFLQQAVRDIARVVGALRAVQHAVTHGGAARRSAAAVAEAEADTDLDYLLEHAPRALDSCAEGVDRVGIIVGALKELSHPQHGTMASVDLNEVVRGTLALARNHYKYVAALETQFADLPPVSCVAGSISQVVLHLLLNAAHAITDAIKGGRAGKGTITVTTQLDGDHVVIAVRDTGAGIPDDVRPRIFEPFYSTRAAGKGTGQGLAVVHAVVTGTHGGTIAVDTSVGQGSTFQVRLPVAGRATTPRLEDAA